MLGVAFALELALEGIFKQESDVHRGVVGLNFFHPSSGCTNSQDQMDKELLVFTDNVHALRILSGEEPEESKANGWVPTEITDNQVDLVIRIYRLHKSYMLRVCT